MNQNNDSQFKEVPSVVEDCLLFEHKLADSEAIGVGCATVWDLWSLLIDDWIKPMSCSWNWWALGGESVFGHLVQLEDDACFSIIKLFNLYQGKHLNNTWKIFVEVLQ